MSVRAEAPERTENLIREAYVLLSEFSRTVDTALEGDHPCRESLENWLSRYEAGAPASFAD